MRFQDIIGQQTACTQLRQAYKHQRLSHAYIFDGPAGVGKMASDQIIDGAYVDSSGAWVP